MVVIHIGISCIVFSCCSQNQHYAGLLHAYVLQGLLNQHNFGSVTNERRAIPGMLNVMCIEAQFIAERG